MRRDRLRGRDNRCKPCRCAVNAEWRARRDQAEWRAKNREYHRRWRLRNPEKARAKHARARLCAVRRYHKENGERPLVYVISGAGLHKIGVTRAPVYRYSVLRSESPVALEVVLEIGCGSPRESYALEARLHERFACKREHGEWFRLSGSDVEEIRVIVGLLGAA